MAMQVTKPNQGQIQSSEAQINTTQEAQIQSNEAQIQPNEAQIQPNVAYSPKGCLHDPALPGCDEAWDCFDVLKIAISCSPCLSKIVSL